MAQDGWLILERERTGVGADPLHELTGCPGLWKRVGAEGNRQVFELPLHVLRAAGSEGWEETGEGVGQTAVDAVDSFAETDLGGPGSAADWCPPSAQRLDALLPPGSLTVQTGGIVLQGSVHREAERLALKIPLCSSIPEPISSSRRHWFRELLLDGQNSWRMVRLCWDEKDDSGRSVPWVEVDLTGAPTQLLEPLIPAALAAIRWVVAWMAHSADFLADGTRHCRLLEVCLTRD
jgi:hypothetical protein